MDFEYNNGLKENDEEYKKGLIPQENHMILNNEIPPEIYNISFFQTNIIVNYLQKAGLLKSKFICPICLSEMNMILQNSSIDKLVWRCHKRNPQHDIKKNIREGSIFEGFQIKITILYFIIYFCFIENISIREAQIKCDKFASQIGEKSITTNSIYKFYFVLRQKIKNKMHHKWDSELLGIEINSDLGYPSVEIDESKIISSGNLIFWMFGLIDLNTKDTRIRCILSNRTKNNLLNFVKRYVHTNEDEDEDEDGDIIIGENTSIRTRIFSDCFQSYQPINFRNLGYILKRVNHSIWFGVGSLNTNTIESLWHQIKTITHNFTGLSVDSLKKRFNNNDNEITNYIDGWL